MVIKNNPEMMIVLLSCVHDALHTFALVLHPLFVVCASREHLCASKLVRFPVATPPLSSSSFTDNFKFSYRINTHSIVSHTRVQVSTVMKSLVNWDLYISGEVEREKS